MPPIVIPIYFDYASTLCYVAWRIVGELERELGFAALWKGVPIRTRDRHCRPGNPLSPLERMKIANVIAECGVAVTPPDHWIDSGAALEGAEIARDAGCFAAYHAGVFRAVFELGRDVAQADVLGAIATAADLDHDRFLGDLRTHRMAARLDGHRREADRCAALGYPAFILGDFPLIGIQPIATMRMLLARYLERRAAEPGN